MRIIRFILGLIILTIDWLTTPRGIKREKYLQAKVDAATAKLALYQYKACPFCVKVRRAAKRNSLKIATFDAKREAGRAEELIAGGGKLKVPCLKIEDQSGQVQWMYESKQIIAYLDNRFGSDRFKLDAPAFSVEKADISA